MQALFSYFVCMILVIACKDKEKKSHFPSGRHEFAVFAKKKSSVVNRNLKTKQQSSQTSLEKIPKQILVLSSRRSELKSTASCARF